MSARLIVLALIDRDPTVVVEMPAPQFNGSVRYAKGYASGWTRRLADVARSMID